MMVVDTSAVLAILLDEPERDTFRRLLLPGPSVISAGTLVETLRVASRHKRRTAPDGVWEFLELFAVAVVPVDAAQARLADEGQRRFGIGRAAPPAVLDFGDLFAYALARHLDAPLLYKGDDFGRTDLRPAFSL
ncbi:MAG TPA: type II toxin-antitoxin system VapC family toxin [Geminicoccaceae bacterium]|nr:type II toxin-antitoxin system VapC family toxin [Geminicoccaceae bacterium]